MTSVRARPKVVECPVEESRYDVFTELHETDTLLWANFRTIRRAFSRFGSLLK